MPGSTDSKWFIIDEGVSAIRISLMHDVQEDVSGSPSDIMWITVLEGDVTCTFSFPAGGKSLHRGDSSLLAWPKDQWHVHIDCEETAVVALIRITLNALHRMLAVEFASASERDSGMDYSALSRTVHLSPVLIRNLEKIFLEPPDSLFKGMAQKGSFMVAFAEMLGRLFGREIDRCPYHIDTDTERKIHGAQKFLVEHLDQPYDIHQLALDFGLPKDVLTEGFRFLFGKPLAEYIQDYKFEKARIMLESGRYLIKEVSFALGYQNPSHFISAFKQRFGLTPKQWSKQQLKSARGMH